MAGGVRVIGAERLVSTLHGAADDLDDLAAAGQRAVQVIVPRARSAAPHRTGRLAAGITGEAQGREVVLGAGAVYAGVQEWGWPARHIPAQPYLVPAVEDTEAAWVDTYAAEVQTILDRVEGA